MSLNLTPIGKHVEKIENWNPLQALSPESFGYIDLSAVDKDSKTIHLDAVVSIKSSEAPSRARQLVQANDILVATVRPNLNGVAVVPESLEGATASTGYCVLRANQKTLDSQYLYYWVQTNSFVADMMSKATGANYPAVSDRIIKDSLIPLPPLAEQKRIAAILDKADAIRRKRQQAIQLADDFLRSVFLDMFGDPVTNPKGWETKKLGDLARIRRGASPRPINDFLGGSVPWIKIGDATKGENIYLTSTAEHVTETGANKSVYLSEGALIFANCGVSLGFARILKIAGCIHDGWLSIEDLDKDLSKIFLLKWINQLTQHFRKIAPEGTQPNLNTGIMKNQDVILPPIGLQNKYENLLLRHDELIERLGLALDDSEKQFNSLSQKAFSGQL